MLDADCDDLGDDDRRGTGGDDARVDPESILNLHIKYIFYFA